MKNLGKKEFFKVNLKEKMQKISISTMNLILSFKNFCLEDLNHSISERLCLRRRLERGNCDTMKPYEVGPFPGRLDLCKEEFRAQAVKERLFEERE